MTNNSIIIITTVIFTTLLFSACGSSKKLKNTRFENDLFIINDVNCKEEKKEGTDSQIGTLTCGDIILNYDYGWYSNPGPLTLKEKFRNSFNAVHYTRFFEEVGMDKKVYKIFLDSVHIRDVRPKIESDELMIPCDPCNTTAVIDFMGRRFLYPTTMAEEALKENDNIEVTIRDAYYYKYYVDKNGNSGLYVSPLKNNFKRKNCLSITSSAHDKAKVKSILKNVRLQ